MSSKARRTHAAAQQDEYGSLSHAIARILFPVMICMALAVYLVHSMGDARNCESAPRREDFIRVPGDELFEQRGTSRGGTEYKGKDAVIFVGMFFAAIIVFTFVLMALYKYGYIKIIFGWLFFSVSLIYAFVGGSYLYEFCRSHCIDVDWITLVFVVWNFTITGLMAIFYTVPRLVNQAFLIVMSALMATIFRKIPEWATWVILVFLSGWDLFAVLAPCGPLKALVKIAQERGDPLPALIYDTNPGSVGRDVEAQPAVVFPSKEDKRRIKDNLDQKREMKKVAKADAAAAKAAGVAPQDGGDGDGTAPIKTRKWRRKRAASDAAASTAAGAPAEEATASQGNANGAATQAAPAARGEAAARAAGEGVGTLGRHLKLGLGDFVFYSILVAQASQRGAMTAVTSFVAILTGLCATLFLVIVYRKALPALPISIALGLIFYFLTRYTIQPFIDNLLPELLFH